MGFRCRNAGLDMAETVSGCPLTSFGIDPETQIRDDLTELWDAELPKAVRSCARGSPVRNIMFGRSDIYAQMSSRRGCAYDAWLALLYDVSVTRASSITLKWIRVEQYWNILQFILE